MTQSPTNKELEERIKYLEQELFRLRKRSEMELREENEDRFKTLAEAAQEGIFILENGYCIEANLNGCQMFGYSYEEIIGRKASSVFVHEDRELVKQNIIDEVTTPYEALALRKDGSQFFAEIKGKNFTFRGRKVRVTSVIDVTNRKRAEQRLIESESKYREVIENAADGILIGNLRGEIVEVNKGFLKMTGYSRNDVMNRHIKFLFDPEVLEKKPLRFDLLNKGQSIIIERDIIDVNGKPIPIEMNSKRPHANYYLAIIRDLRERRKAEENLISANKKLLDAKERAEESDRLKSAFLANMSHEIRTPMNGIIGFTELLRNPDLTDDERSDHLNVVISSGHQLLNIINDILEISRIETGQLTLTKKFVKVDSVLRSLFLFFQPMAEDTRNKLSISMDMHDLEPVIYTDEGKLRQILTNLISNALKFTNNGSVTLSFDQEGDYGHFAVRDTGIGIPADAIETIFDRFVQLKHVGVAKKSGTGLGLSICHKLVSLLNGEIWVESKINEGSRFHFLLPLRPKEE
ncbi:PAS domain S-box protein [Marinilabilia rubra]|uniref:Sensory/regulatory protein RpfC n=1 Tax=Marinilabilia rubra TaxID=2162893 RepID=A0A2U2B4D5_9BACT|nr:PAS domain S-box protein [Marinilabilia rubra]PWD97916.1 hypothetical protein DDZ16_18335 [Marinilabilia rubra]